MELGGKKNNNKKKPQNILSSSKTTLLRYALKKGKEKTHTESWFQS